MSKTFKTLNVSYGVAQPRPRPDGRRSESRGYYDPAVGQFLTPDPLMDMEPGQSPYAYVSNNPVRYTDPTGMYKDKGEAETQRERARGQHHDVEVGDVYQSGDEWGFNIIDGHNSSSVFKGKYGTLAQRFPKFFKFLTSNIHDVTPAVELNFGKKGFDDSEQQQHSGDGWFLQGDGSDSGWSINAPKADPNGENTTIDISGLFPKAGGVNNIGRGVLNPLRAVGGFENNVERVQRAYEPVRTPVSLDTIWLSKDTINETIFSSYHLKPRTKN